VVVGEIMGAGRRRCAGHGPHLESTEPKAVRELTKQWPGGSPGVTGPGAVRIYENDAEVHVTDGAGASGSLVAAAIRGDPEAVRALWQEHRRWVAAVLLAYKPREAELEDLLQDVAMTFVKRIGELRDEAALKGWLRTVATNAARAAARSPERKRRRPWLRLVRAEGTEAAGLERTAEAAPDETAGTMELASRVMELAMELPESYREPLLLKSLRGLSYREIGAMLDLPETTIETRIARGRRMLRELVMSGGGGGHRTEPAAAARAQG
jgi:RNA polymerase sigma factor (sigma-70 family)